MTYYKQLGSIPHKRHTQFRQPDGSLYHEEVMGIHGFAGIQSILYHVHPPTRVREIERYRHTEMEYEDRGALRHRHLKTAPVEPHGDTVSGRVPMMGNGRKLNDKIHIAGFFDRITANRGAEHIQPLDMIPPAELEDRVFVLFDESMHGIGSGLHDMPKGP